MLLLSGVAVPNKQPLCAQKSWPCHRLHPCMCSSSHPPISQHVFLGSFSFPTTSCSSRRPLYQHTRLVSLSNPPAQHSPFLSKAFTRRNLSGALVASPMRIQ